MILSSRELVVRYGALVAVDGVDFDIAPASIHGVLGPNGAGKSTLLDVLSGRTKPSSGTVSFRGDDITSRSAAWRRRQGISRSFQRTSVFPALTVGEQLEVVAHHAGEPDLEGLVDSLGLGAHWSSRCELISYGDQRRVDVALALIGGPAVLLLDEPAAGLTAQETEVLIDHIRHLAVQRGISVVLVEHDVDAVFRACDPITVLDLGRVIAHGNPQEIREDRRVIEAYLGTAGAPT